MEERPHESEFGLGLGRDLAHYHDYVIRDVDAITRRSFRLAAFTIAQGVRKN
jgi:hypothetical protein